jgi:hypothetical protein
VTEGAELTGVQWQCWAASVVGEVGDASGSCSEVVGEVGYAFGSCSKVVREVAHALGLPHRGDRVLQPCLGVLLRPRLPELLRGGRVLRPGPGELL